MRRLLRWLLGRDAAEAGDDDVPGDEPEAAAPAEEPEVEHDHEEARVEGDSAYAPAAAHARLLARVRRDAEADAVRHAEDMLDRQFPISARAESTARDRLARLRGEFVARDTELRESAAARRREIGATSARRDATEAALSELGSPADQMDRDPLQAQRSPGWRVIVALAIGVGLGYLIAAGKLDPIWLGLIGVASIAVVAALFVTPPEDIEDKAVTALRRSHAEISAQLTALNSSVDRIEIEREALRGTTRTLAEGEIAFGERMAADYVSAAFSAMPAGSLEGGREFAAQREPEVELPDWIAELEMAA